MAIVWTSMQGIGIIVGAAAAVGIAVWLLRHRHIEKLTSHVIVEEDEHEIDAELDKLDGLVGDLKKMEEKSQKAAGGEEVEKKKAEQSEGEAPASEEAKDEEKKEDQKNAGDEDNQKEAEQPTEEESEKGGGKGGAAKAGPEAPEEVLKQSLADALKARIAGGGGAKPKLTAQETTQYSALKDLISEAQVLIKKDEKKKAYVLYMKIQRSYDQLPKKIQMHIHAEYNGLRSAVNRTLPELEIFDDADGQFQARAAKEKADAFLNLLAKAEEAQAKGDRARALILYSEIKGMYPMAPPKIKKEVHKRCVLLYQGFTAQAKGKQAQAEQAKK